MEPYVAECVLKEAARVWLEKRRVFIRTIGNMQGEHFYKPWGIVSEATDMRDLPLRKFDDYTECQLEAMLAIIEENPCPKSK